MWVHCKWKVKDASLTIFHTKVKVANRIAKEVKKKKGSWYRRIFVDEIFAGIEGTFWTKDNNGVCECVTPNPQPDDRNTHSVSNFPWLKRGKCVYRPNIQQTRNIRDQSMKYKAGVVINGTPWEIWDYFRICN